MSFESLSERHEFSISDFPEEWLPLTYLYDADLPLFPLCYFHCLDPSLDENDRPRARDRVYGYVRNLSWVEGALRVSVVLNKDLTLPANARYIEVVEAEVRERLGLGDPATLSDVNGALTGALANANGVLKELWHKIVDECFGRLLPFGRMWDGVFGLPRFIASWNSDGGRKGELIQTHYYMTAFGERIQCGQGVHVDFYLLPTFSEIQDGGNPLAAFPKYSQLLRAAADFVESYCETVELSSGEKLSAFRLKKAVPSAKQLDTDAILEIMSRAVGLGKEALFENYNAFNRGPARAVLSLLMHHDLRVRNWDPQLLTPASCGDMYIESKGSYQSPKVMQLYAQQCFGSRAALPIDNWVKTFLSWPLGFDAKPSRTFYTRVFSCSGVWGKVERLIWMASQARKVHSSVAAEMLWCIRYGNSKGAMRGANPLACKICEQHIREVCPAYSRISDANVVFNAVPSDYEFALETSSGDLRPHQMFIRCVGVGTDDMYSARDRVGKFRSYPMPPHSGQPMKVRDFLEEY